MLYQGVLQKMRTSVDAADATVKYDLRMGEFSVPLNPWLGQPFTLQYTGRIFCLNCGRGTNKSFGQGFCFRCFRSSAAADMCIMKPETCHYHLGTCREPEWAQSHCFQSHIVYLANSSGIKVGITRHTQIPTRWLDQGAKQALPIMAVSHRRLAGLVEVALAQYVADKTQWQRLLKGEAETLDLVVLRDQLLQQCATELAQLQQQFPEQIRLLTGTPYEFVFPVQQYPSKVKALNLDTQPQVTGILQGIKGQYVLLDSGVLNIRKFGGYEVVLGAEQ